MTEFKHIFTAMQLPIVALCIGKSIFFLMQLGTEQFFMV